MKTMKVLWAWLLFASLCCAPGAAARGVRAFVRPVAIGASTTTIHIAKVEFTDTATVVSFYGKNKPGTQMTFAKGTYLLGEDGGKYKVLRGEGMTLGEYYATPQSGESSFKVLFEPLPRKTRFFDLIEGNSSRAYCFYGVHEAGKAPKMPKERDRFVMTPELEREFFKADTACVKGRIEGYSRSQGYSTLQFARENAMTSERAPLTVDIQENGTFELRFPAWHPVEGVLFAHAKNVYKALDFYAVPGQTSELVIKADGSTVYTACPSGPFGRKGSLEHNASNICTYPYGEFSADAGKFGFKDFIDNAMQRMRGCLSLVDYMAWRFGYSPWERHLAECYARLEHGQRIYDYEMDKKFEVFEVMEGMTQKEYDEKMKPLRDPSSYLFMREMPCNDVSCLALDDFDTFMNRYEFSPVIRAFDGQVLHLLADSIAKDDARSMAGDVAVLGADGPSFFGRLTVLREMSNHLKSFYAEYPALFDSVYDNRLAYMDREALRVQAGRLLEKARRQSSLTYKLPDTEGGRLLRRLTEKYKGKYLLIDFWGMYCGPCRSGIEHSKKMREALRNHPDVDFLFISKEGEGPEASYRKYVEEQLDGEDVIQVSGDDYHRLMELFNFLGIPHYETLDPEGKVVRKGLQYDSEEQFLHQLNNLKSKLEN